MDAFGAATAVANGGSNNQLFRVEELKAQPAQAASIASKIANDDASQTVNTVVEDDPNQGSPQFTYNQSGELAASSGQDRAGERFSATV